MLLDVTSDSGKLLTFVVLGHMHVMPIIESPSSCTLVGVDKILTPEEEAVGNQGADLEDD